jgi:hypothetical protein
MLGGTGAIKIVIGRKRPSLTYGHTPREIGCHATPHGNELDYGRKIMNKIKIGIHAVMAVKPMEARS